MQKKTDLALNLGHIMVGTGKRDPAGQSVFSSPLTLTLTIYFENQSGHIYVNE
jgi:hypothetical protein